MSLEGWVMQISNMLTGGPHSPLQMILPPFSPPSSGLSGQHAAVNFGQCTYGGFIPAHAPLMRRLVPKEHDPEYVDFIKDPQAYFLSL